MKAPSPLLGFNNNVRHKGRVFHIQTEDSGIRHPHIITHLFADGGRILKTTKTSYAEHVDAATVADTVRGMMKEQHKAMFIALRDGRLDHLMEDIPVSPKADVAKPGAPAMAAAEDARAPMVTAPANGEAAARPAEAAAAEPAVEAIAAPVMIDAAVVAPQAPMTGPASYAETLPPAAAADAPPPADGAGSDQPASPQPPSRRTSRPRLQIDAMHRAAHAPTLELESPTRGATIDLDLDALERAAVEAQTPMLQRTNDLPPPPASALGKKGISRPATGYSVTTPTQGTPRPAPEANAGSTQRRVNPTPPVSPVRGGTINSTMAREAASAGRYAASRPAAIFAAARPQDGSSIFGEDLISEKSLDEVILSYLAEDLDGPGEKK